MEIAPVTALYDMEKDCGEKLTKKIVK